MCMFPCRPTRASICTLREGIYTSRDRESSTRERASTSFRTAARQKCCASLVLEEFCPFLSVCLSSTHVEEEDEVGWLVLAGGKLLDPRLSPFASVSLPPAPPAVPLFAALSTSLARRALEARVEKCFPPNCIVLPPAPYKFGAARRKCSPGSLSPKPVTPPGHMTCVRMRSQTQTVHVHALTRYIHRHTYRQTDRAVCLRARVSKSSNCTREKNQMAVFLFT